MEDLEKLKYPIGKYEPPTVITWLQIEEWIAMLSTLPQEVAALTEGLDSAKLAICYRPGGWTVKQVVHHLADSHINAYTRFHLTLTEDRPVIRPYLENKWAELADGRMADIDLSIALLKATHARLVFLLNTLKPADFERSYFHPEAQQEFTMAYLLGNYAWHGKHHLAHIKSTFK